MRGLPKLKRVSWAPDFGLCQVRLFLSDESPSQVGLGAQDHLQAKASWPSHPTGAAGDETLPPGFEGSHSAAQWQIKLSEVPIIKWRCPPRISLNLNWQVVAGEESQMVEVENEREMRVLEAVYPRPSAIPQNPTFSDDIEESKLMDHQVPLVPIIPIEDEDVPDAPEFSGTSSFTTNLEHQNLVPSLPPQCNIPGTPITPFTDKPAPQALLGSETDAVAVANAAITAIHRSNEQGNLIDHDLLIKILSNPNLFEKLVVDSAAGSNTQVHSPASSDPPHPNPLVNLSDPSHLHRSRMDPSTLSTQTACLGGTSYMQPNGIRPGISPNVRHSPPQIQASPTLSIGTPRVKDVNYYKSLIQQHGDERQEMSRPHGNLRDHQVGTNQEYANTKSRDPKTKFMKPCIYYNSERGCRNGANCAYQHDPSSQQKGRGSMSEVPSAKRMKMEREISS